MKYLNSTRISQAWLKFIESFSVNYTHSCLCSTMVIMSCWWPACLEFKRLFYFNIWHTIKMVDHFERTCKIPEKKTTKNIILSNSILKLWRICWRLKPLFTQLILMSQNYMGSLFLSLVSQCFNFTTEWKITQAPCREWIQNFPSINPWTTGSVNRLD